MTAPRLASSGRITSIGGGRIYVDSLPTPADDGFGFDVSADEERAYAPLLYVDGAVRVILESASPPAPGDALDYLAELKGVLTALVLEHAAAPAEMRERVLRRALNLANTASNAILDEGRAAR